MLVSSDPGNSDSENNRDAAPEEPLVKRDKLLY